MIVDDEHHLSLYFQAISHAHITRRFVRNQLLGKNRILAEQHQAVATLGMDGRILIGIHRLQDTIYLLLILPIGHGFLQAHDIGILFLDILQADVMSFIILCLAAEVPGIIRQHLDTSLRRISLHIDRHVLAHRHKSHQESEYRNQGVLGTEDKPKDQEPQIDDEKDGKQQACIGKCRKLCRIQQIRISHQ